MSGIGEANTVEQLNISINTINRPQNMNLVAEAKLLPITMFTCRSGPFKPQKEQYNFEIIWAEK